MPPKDGGATVAEPNLLKDITDLLTTEVGHHGIAPDILAFVVLDFITNPERQDLTIVGLGDLIHAGNDGHGFDELPRYPGSTSGAME